MASGKDYAFDHVTGKYIVTGSGEYGTITLPPGTVYGIDPAVQPTLCNHEWINIGFTFDKFICKKCDCEKK